jgi:hypothetical protein
MGYVFSMCNSGIFFSGGVVLISGLISFSGPFFEGYFSRISPSIS